MLTLQIAVGIWLGGMFLIGTISIACIARDKIVKARRYGYSWWQAFVPTR